MFVFGRVTFFLICIAVIFFFSITLALQTVLYLRILSASNLGFHSLQVVNWLNTKGQQFLQKHTEIGDSLGHVKTLKEEFDNFENKAKVRGRVNVVSF